MGSITINSNQLSLNAQRRLGEASSSLSQSFNRLSSGLRVNRAVDDAAGLAVSEVLKLDSRLSSQALRNVNDGISMLSIINGALDSQKGILFRMVELAEQSANGVNSQTQRDALQKEYMSLLEEFDRVASSAKFNNISLLRNQNTETISLMAGITGVNESLLTVAAANSHRFAGLIAMKSDLDKDGDVDALDFGNMAALLNPTAISNTTYPPNTGVFQIKDSNGSTTTVRLQVSRPLSKAQKCTPPASPLNIIQMYCS